MNYRHGQEKPALTTYLTKNHNNLSGVMGNSRMRLPVA